MSSHWVSVPPSPAVTSVAVVQVVASSETWILYADPYAASQRSTTFPRCVGAPRSIWSQDASSYADAHRVVVLPSTARSAVNVVPGSMPEATTGRWRAMFVSETRGRTATRSTADVAPNVTGISTSVNGAAAGGVSFTVTDWVRPRRTVSWSGASTVQPTGAARWNLPVTSARELAETSTTKLDVPPRITSSRSELVPRA